MLDQIPLQLDKEGIKEREDGKRGAVGGDYSREATILNIKGEAIIRGKAIIQGNTVVSSLIYISSVIDKVQCLGKKG